MAMPMADSAREVGTKGGSMTSSQPMEVSDLTEKEGQILSLLVLGYKVGDMAAKLNISTNYVYVLIRSLKQRFLAKTNAAIVSRAIAEGVVSTDGVLQAKTG
jgi:DNA-binding CsgD family transcriptional regulator